jgi:hypothetical protein
MTLAVVAADRGLHSMTFVDHRAENFDQSIFPCCGCSRTVRTWPAELPVSLKRCVVFVTVDGEICF